MPLRQDGLPRVEERPASIATMPCVD